MTERETRLRNMQCSKVARATQAPQKNLVAIARKWYEKKLAANSEAPKSKRQSESNSNKESEKTQKETPPTPQKAKFTKNDGQGKYTSEQRMQKREQRKLNKQKKKQRMAVLRQRLEVIEREKKARALIKKLAKLELAVVAIRTTWNNTIISLTDRRGRVKLWTSAGAQRSTRGCKKRSGYANSLAADEVVNFARRKGVKRLGIVLSGPGTGRKWTVKKFIRTRTWRVLKIRSKRNIPHGGCRPPKRPRRRRRGFKG